MTYFINNVFAGRNSDGSRIIWVNKSGESQAIPVVDRLVSFMFMVILLQGLTCLLVTYVHVLNEFISIKTCKTVWN